MRVLLLNENLSRMLSSIESVTMQRARLFKKHFDLNVDILTIDYAPRQEEIRQYYIQQNKLPPATHIRNLFDFLQDIDRVAHVPHPTPAPLYDATDTSLEIVQEPNATRVKQGKWLLQFIKYDANKRIDYVLHYKDNKIIRCYTYDELGFLSKVSMVNKDNKVFSNMLYRPDGTLAAQQYYDIVKDKSEMHYMYTVDRGGTYTCTAHNIDAFVSLWMQHVLLSQPQNTFCIIERNLHYKQFFIDTPREQLRHVYSVPVMHSIHFAYGADRTGKANYLYDSFINRQCTHNAIVTLTDKQNADVAERVGASNVYTIPHMAPTISMRRLSTKHNTHIVYVARLVPVKQHLVALDIFKRVVEIIPDAHLHIYGSGSEEQAICSAITTLGLNGNVTLEGYTDNVNSVFQQAALSILTSLFEGFSVSILESMANGCPVVSFDVLYGPSELLVHGENGYLVPAGDNAAFAEHIVRILQAPALRQRMASNAVRHVYQHFSETVVAGKWKHLLEQFSLQIEPPAGR